MEKEFYMPEAVDRKDVMWYWVDDKAKLDGKVLVTSRSKENLALCSQNANFFRLFQSLLFYQSIWTKHSLALLDGG